MKKVVVFLADGAEEIEAISPVDILRRAGAEVTLAGVGGKEIICAHNIKIVCDKELSEISGEDFDMYVLPGGVRGTESLSDSEIIKDTVKKAYSDGKTVAAICAAPSVLGKIGILNGKRATCYPGFEKYLDGAEFVSASVVCDGNIITSRGAGTAMNFSLALVKALYGQDKAEDIRKAVIA